MADGRVVIDTTLDTTGTKKGFNDLDSSINGIAQRSKLMSQEMRSAFEESNKKLLPFKRAVNEAKFGFFELSKSMNTWKGTNQEFMNEVAAAGAIHKKATDDMLKNNDLLKSSFVQSVGVMLNRSTQASRIGKTLDSLNNPLYNSSKGFLKVADSLGKLGAQGNATVLALKMLGPTANSKDLQDRVMQINTGLMATPIIALAAAAATAILFGTLHEGAKEIPGYEESFKTMIATVKEAFKPMVEVFAAVMMKVYDFITVIGQMAISFNEAHPFLAKMIQGFLMLLPVLALILSPLAIGIGFFNGLLAVWGLIAPMAMAVISGIAAMSGPLLLIAAGIVALIAVGVLLYKNWETIKEKIMSIWDRIKTYFINVSESIKSTVTTFVKSIVEYVNERFGYLFKALKTILTNVKTIFTTIWKTIKSTLAGIILAIIQLISGDFKGLKTTINTILTNIKESIKTIWSSIKTIFTTYLGAVKTLITNIFNGIKTKITTTMSSVKTKITTTISNIKDLFESIKEIDLKDIGEDIMEGLINGIESMIENLKKKISSVVSSIKDGLKGALDIHSPSRWMKNEIGKNMMLGMQEGMDPKILNIPDISKKIQSGLSNGLLGGSSNTTNNNQNMSRSLTVQVNNTGAQAMSYSEIYRRTQQQARIMGAQIGLI